MTRSSLLILLILVCGLQARAQSCFPNGIDFYSQNDIISFQNNYPNCKVIEGDVNIVGFDITSLAGLGNLTDIKGYLFIEDCDNLHNLIGLQNLKTIGGLYLASNDGLANLSGLSKLTTINGLCFIQDNSIMTSLSGIQNLTTINGDFWLHGSPALTNVNGLNNLNTITGEFWFNENHVLSDISALQNLHTIGGGLNLWYNHALTDLSGFSGLQSPLDSIDLYVNLGLTSLHGLEGVPYVTGDVGIYYHPNLSSLDGLSGLTSVGGNIQLNNNDALPNLNGWHNITTIGGNYSMGANDLLQDMTGLNSLQSVGGNLEIVYSPVLSSLNGLNALQSVGKDLRLEYDNALTNITALSNLNQLGGTLKINNSYLLQNLTGLDGLTAVGGGIVLDNNLGLTALTGLQNVTATGGKVVVSNHPVLANLDAFEHLTQIGDTLYIFQNPILTSLDGLKSLQYVGSRMAIIANNGLTQLGNLNQLTTIGGNLEILACYALTHLDNLNSLSNVGGDLVISSNVNLTDISGLQHLNNLGGGLEIQYNYSLSDCAIAPVCQQLFNKPTAVKISFNSADCASAEKVEENCGTTPVFVAVKMDNDGDCQPDPANMPVPEAAVWLNAPGQNTLRPADGNGLAGFRYFDNGPCSLSLAQFPTANWDVCPLSTVPFVPGTSPDTVLFLLKPLNQCPELTVHLGLPSVFPDCSAPAPVSVSVKNSGTTLAQGVQIAVVMPPELDLINTDPTLVAQVGDTLFFNLADLPPLSEGNILLSVKTKCSGVPLHRALCWSAFGHINNSCTTNTPAGAEVQLQAECTGDKVRFTLKNIGNASTQGLYEYTLIRNATVQESHAFSLAPQQSMLVEVPSDGATYRMTATRQNDGVLTAVSQEGCGGFTPGYVTTFWQEKGPLFSDYDCREVHGLQGFAGKNAIPSGVGPDHLIPPNRPLQYTVDFYNFEAQPITKVVVSDLLPADLDVNSIRLGAASHPYSWQVKHGHLLEVVFDPINLTDTLGNIADRRGFFTYEMDQKADLPDGTLLENTAGAIFDNTYFVFKDTVRHTVNAAGSQGMGCLSEGISFHSQADVDNFPLLYPDCSRIDGDVEIGGAGITDLTPLNRIKSIGGRLWFNYCPDLHSLEGLNNLTVIGSDLYVYFMYGLTDLTGLDRLYKINGGINLYQNYGMTSTKGIDSLVYVGRDILVTRNDQLLDVDFLKNVDVLPGNITLDNNGALVNLAGFQKMVEIQGNLVMGGSPALLSLEGLDSLKKIGGHFSQSYAMGNRDMEGLGALRTVGGNFGISSGYLRDFKGLNSLDSIGGILYIGSNFFLQNLDGLSQLRTVGSLDVIYNDSLQNLTGLDHLQIVRDSFSIVGNPWLIDLSGLSALDTIGHGCYIADNPSLNSLNGAAQLVHIGGNLVVQNNPLLTNMAGLTGLETIGGDFLVGSPAVNFQGLDHLQSVGGNFQVHNALESLTGVETLEHIGGDVEIWSNPVLPDLQGLNGLKTIGGNLVLVDNATLTGLNGLNQLRSVGGHLDVQNSPNILNFNGLDSLVLIGSDLNTNPAMLSFAGLEHLRQIGGQLRLSNHTQLQDFSGLNSLDSIGGQFNCTQASNLKSMAGLEKLRVIGGDLYLSDNDKLTSLAALESLISVGPTVVIFYNDSLTDCSIVLICSRILAADPGQEIYLQSNGLGCNLGELACNTLPMEVAVLLDNNGNCLPDASDTPVEGAWVRLTKGAVQVGVRPSDAQGHTSFEYFNTGTLTLDLPQLPSNYWGACQDPIHIAPGQSADTLKTTFLLSSLQPTPCPELTTTLGLPSFFRGCLVQSEVQVTTENKGSSLAEGVRTALVVPSVMEILATDPLFSSQHGDTLFYEMGDLKPFEIATVKLIVRTKCDTFLLGQTLCWEAFSTLDNPCPATQQAISDIKLSALCTGDSVRFTLKNIGDAPTLSLHQYRIIRNTEIFETGQFSLGSQQSTTVSVPADSATYRMEATKWEDGTMTATALENCAGLTPGLITAFWLEKGPLEYDFDCRTVIGSFDPNLKSAIPTGAGADHIIEANRPLMYTIDFQNTGTDTAFRVLLRDELSPYLDPATFRPVAASHPYTWEIRGQNILDVLFFPIALPDSNTNQATSHGFFSFEINQVPDLPVWFSIWNKADIFFDYNWPVSTNWVNHTIGELNVYVTTVEIPGQVDAWQVLNNPTRDQATFQAIGFIPGDKNFALYDASGRLMRTVQFSGQSFVFQRDGLSAGVYFFRIQDQHNRLFSGKIVVVD